MQLVVLAAGHGRRFGGLKQLAPVGPGGEAIMDYTAADALDAGFDAVVLVVRPEVREELLEHVAAYWPSDLEVRPVSQGPVAGTAQAVASAREALSGAFAVANADDLYGRSAMAALAEEVRSITERSHVIIGYRLADTVITDAPVTRGVCDLSGGTELVRVVEQTVVRTDGHFSGRPVGAPDESEPNRLGEDAVVSMNLWGFHPSILDDLDAALARFDPEAAPHVPGRPPELLLPSVVADLVAGGTARVKVRVTEGRCIGLTHPDDLPLVRDMVLAERHSGAGPALS